MSTITAPALDDCPATMNDDPADVHWALPPYELTLCGLPIGPDVEKAGGDVRDDETLCRLCEIAWCSR